MQPTIHLVFSSSHSPSPILFSKTNTGSITTSAMAQTITMSGSSLTGSQPSIDGDQHDCQAPQNYAEPNNRIIQPRDYRRVSHRYLRGRYFTERSRYC